MTLMLWPIRWMGRTGFVGFFVSGESDPLGWFDIGEMEMDERLNEAGGYAFQRRKSRVMWVRKRKNPVILR